MKQETLFTLDTPYRQKLDVEGFRFGKGEKSLCIVGALRGNEVQQMYVCSQLVQQLKWMEAHNDLYAGHEILVIPCVNHFSMNVGSRFWAMDHTDINRMFPGYADGETTQRIAAALFDTVKEYQYGIQFASFYMPGDFVPHVRMMETGCHTASLANLFGLPFVMLHKPGPYDTATLNYNWQLWDTNAFSIYTKETDRIDDASAAQAVTAVLRFLSRLGVVKYTCLRRGIPPPAGAGGICRIRSGAGPAAGPLHRRGSGRAAQPHQRHRLFCHSSSPVHRAYGGLPHHPAYAAVNAHRGLFPSFAQT